MQGIFNRSTWGTSSVKFWFPVVDTSNPAKVRM